MDIIGKNVDEFLNKFEYEEFDYGTLNNTNDETYTSGSKFLLNISQHGLMFSEKPIGLYFSPFNVPTGTRKLFFSMKYKTDIVLGGFSIGVVELNNDLETIMATNDLNLWDNYGSWLKTFEISLDFNFDTKTIEFELDLSSNTKQVFMYIKPTYETLHFYDAFSILSKDLRIKYNDFFTDKPKNLLFVDGSYNYEICREEYEKRRITYFVSEEVPELPLNLDDYDFANLWFCNRDIYDEEENLIYKNNTMYSLETTVDYENNTYSIIGWRELDITKEQIENGYEHYFFFGWRTVKIPVAESQMIGRFDADLEFGDITFSTINYVWSPAEGESNVDNNFKFNKDGMYITNNEEGFKREITASKDISTNLQTGNKVWNLTSDGMWTDVVSANKIILGNYHIVAEDDTIKFRKLKV